MVSAIGWTHVTTLLGSATCPASWTSNDRLSPGGMSTNREYTFQPSSSPTVSPVASPSIVAPVRASGL